MLFMRYNSSVICNVCPLGLIYVLFTELRDGQQDYVEDSPTTNKDHIYDNEIQISPSGRPF